MSKDVVVKFDMSDPATPILTSIEGDPKECYYIAKLLRTIRIPADIWGLLLHYLVSWVLTCHVYPDL